METILGVGVVDGLTVSRFLLTKTAPIVWKQMNQLASRESIIFVCRKRNIIEDI